MNWSKFNRQNSLEHNLELHHYHFHVYMGSRASQHPGSQRKVDHSSVTTYGDHDLCGDRAGVGHHVGASAVGVCPKVSKKIQTFVHYILQL